MHFYSFQIFNSTVQDKNKTYSDRVGYIWEYMYTNQNMHIGIWECLQEGKGREKCSFIRSSKTNIK